MGKIVAGMTVSLDGFVQDENGSAGPLYPDLASLQGTPYLTDMAAATGSSVAPSSWSECQMLSIPMSSQ